MKLRLTYLVVFLVMLLALTVFPKTGGYIWQEEIINPLSALLFTLLVYLTGRIAQSTHSTTGILCTALFILLFCPDSRQFFNRDETAVIELTSTGIVPFFISQYTRISNKNFKYGYFLMLLMGIFCSYTHDSVTIPLCASFLTHSYLQRDRRFRLACWPMVIGFVVGTTLSVLQSTYWNLAELGDLDALSSQTANGFIQLWETKVFMFAVLLTIYFLSSRRRRKRLWRISREHKLLTYCLLYSFCAIPFAPLGFENAISGVCFFCMFWALFLFQEILALLRERRQLKRLRKE
ncbi:MAG: hypothetical protein LUC45_09575 [Paraprevotella sp.]|nr:hypothetical protein [Paraprevotella sp.]